MPPINRSRKRNVHIYDANDPTTVLGGLRLANGVTNASFYSLYSQIEKDDHPLQPGKYFIVAADPFNVNNEPWLVRTISYASGTGTQTFSDAVRSRDRRCIISGREALDADDDNWRGFEAAHIFPLAYEGYWSDYNYGRWITIPPANPTKGSIILMQNGLLLDSAIHQEFDGYDLSVNPDHLDQRLLNDPQRPVDQLLQWHFRQAVLVNMRGAREPIFGHGFPPGSDIVGDIFHGLRAAERMV
ncbi:hypothetical protein K469DRAFT_733016 [Zopfia rhizophila CBS 207.26]|uniref:Uncharacterized protein n=1 Tax=Zopfia rhizophila CBS 207.26 TaxID=1314779 RepID=A0A6A6DCP3_9PEZI|nr:hypothetical protein K469DRAFT_733016 [Zopfia rhizophila CBS 207.26]